MALYPVLWYVMTMKRSDYAKQLGVTDKTAWQWWTAGHLEADPLPTGTIMVREPHTAATGGALSARVSSAEEQDDALPQLQRLRDSAAARGALGVAEVSERASGVNDGRPKRTKLLPARRVGVLVVEHRDCLTPVSDGSLAPLLELQGRRGEELSPRASGDGVGEECVALLTRRAARSSGRRSSTRRAERIRACRACGARVLHRESEDA
jgi:putative resolvase